MGHDEVFIPFAVAAITPLGCAWVASRYVSSSNKWVYSGVILGTAFLSWKFIVPRVLNAVGYPVPFEAESECEHRDYVTDVCEVLSWADYSCIDCGATQHHEFPENYKNVEALDSIDTDNKIRSDFFDQLERDYPRSDDWDAESFAAEKKKKKSGCMHYKYGKHKWAYTHDGKICIDCGNQGVRSRWDDNSKWSDAESFSADNWSKTDCNYSVYSPNHFPNPLDGERCDGGVQCPDCKCCAHHCELLYSKDLELCMVNNEHCGCFGLYEDDEESFGAESKFVKPYDRKKGIDLKRGNNGRFRRRLTIPLKKEAEHEGACERCRNSHEMNAAMFVRKLPESYQDFEPEDCGGDPNRLTGVFTCRECDLKTRIHTWIEGHAA